jgi:hypothetical protein
MTTLMLAVMAGGAGYVASIFTWPRLRQAVIGVENEIDDLRAKARALEADIKTRLGG